MKKTFFSILLLASCLMAAAADPFRTFASRVAASCVSFDYTFESMHDGVKFTGNGSAAVQGEAFRMEGNGLKIFSDGKTRWTVDADAQELIIEPVDAAATDFISNPALLVSAADKAFDAVPAGAATFKGQTVSAYSLTPRKDVGISRLQLYFRQDELVGVSLTVDDGTTSEFALSHLTFADPGSLAAFRYDERSAGSGWVVTDLR